VSRHVHSQRAQSWFDQAGDEKFFFCRFVQITVLRVLTTEAALGADTQTMRSAWKLLDKILDDERISFLPEPHGLDPEFRSLTQFLTRSPKVWADAYLLAFASTAGLKLVTFDRALKGRGAEVLVL
jgi:hypothetical protein